MEVGMQDRSGKLIRDSDTTLVQKTGVAKDAGSDRDQASVAPASVADGQTGRRVSKRVLLGLYPHSPRTWDHRWQYQLANAKR